MKIGKIFNSYVPQKKCGAEVAGAAVLGGLQTDGNIYGAERNINAQQSENQKNRDWQTIEAEKQRNWNRDMMTGQNKQQD